VAKSFGISSPVKYLSFLAIAGWFALIGQFYLIMVNSRVSAPETIARYFTFFTILTNILVALCCTIIVLKPTSGWSKFFSRATTLTAITVYILIVGIVYNLILRWLWRPEGLQRIIDELLHLIIPVAFVIFWLIYVPRGQLKWSDIFGWLIYPLIYLGIILMRGAFSGYYPYPFVDVNQLGYPKTLLNCLVLALSFTICSLAFVGIDKLMRKRVY